MENAVIERVKHVVEYFNISKKAFAEKINMEQTTVNNQIIGKRSISFDLIKNIADTFDEISLDWLITGKGEMIRNEDGVMPVINREFRGSPYYNVDFIGGFDVILNDQTINPDYYIDFTPYNEKGVIWCNITGKSMEPEINSGDIIAMKELTTNIEYLPFGEIYGFVTNEYRTVKKLGKSDKDGYIRLIPTNKSDEFAPQDIPTDMVIKVFSVLGSVKRF